MCDLSNKRMWLLLQLVGRLPVEVKDQDLTLSSTAPAPPCLPAKFDRLPCLGSQPIVYFNQHIQDMETCFRDFLKVLQKIILDVVSGALKV